MKQYLPKANVFYVYKTSWPMKAMREKSMS